MTADGSTTMIIFIAAVTAAALASAVMVGVIGDMTVELRDQGHNLARALGTDLSIVNDPQNVPYDDPDLTVYVKNTGSAELFPEELTVFVDGVHRDFTSTFLDGATSWTQGVVAELTVTAAGLGNNEDHTVRVVHTPSVSDDLDFRT